MLRHLDTAVLRSFVLIAEGKTFAETADIVGRSASAITLQIQKLEEQLGQPVFARTGRAVELTIAGERLLAYGRRILALNDEAWAAFRAPIARVLRFGTTQDFSDTILPTVLRRLRMEHAEVSLTLRVDRSQALIEAIDGDELDVAIAITRPHECNRGTIATEALHWIGRDGFTLAPDAALPLALFEPPCSFRTAALATLAAAGRRHEIVASSPSLSGLRAAAEAGIALTVRTRHMIAGSLADVGGALGLPAVPDVAFALYTRDDQPWPARDDLAELCRRAFA